MRYKRKAESLIEAISGKLRIIENVAQGTMQLPASQVIEVINDAKNLSNQLAELISIENEGQ